MTRRRRVPAALAVVLSLLGLASPTAEAAGGDRHAMPSAYSWLGPSVPVNTYSIAIVRGRTPASALRAVGGVRRTLGRLTPQQAADYLLDHADTDTELPAVVQVQRLGDAVVLYEPYGFRPDFKLAKLSANGIAAAFSTTYRGRKDAKVAKRGEVIRAFSVGRRPPRAGALPEERGLDFGARRQNQYATGWAFNERLTLTHISLRWFAGRHPTYVVNGPAY